MRNRAVRFTLLALLVAATAVAAVLLRDIDRRGGDLLVAQNDVDARLDRLSDTLAGIGAAQQSYVAPGQSDEPWFERMSGLVRQLYDDTATLRPLLHAETAPAAMQALSEGTDALIGADTRARENLRLGQPLMAADVIFSDSRNTLDAMSGRVRDLRAAEHAALDTARARLTQERWTVVGVTALVWLVGVVLLVPIAAGSTAVTPPVSLSESSPPVPERRQTQSLDLVAAADLCTALSRLTTTAALPGLLGRAAGVLDAPGIILWMSAGEELFAVTAHGYRPQMIARLGPITRDAENATAAAWRSGEVTTVGGEADGHGAIVAPMFGPDTCIGVLAIEVRHGREQDASVRAIAAMIAAQLATAVSAWPAASPVQAPAEVARQLAREFRSAGN